MARLIDGDKLLECYDGLDKYHVPVGAVKANINDMPTVDAVPVCRCKNCVHGIEEDGGIKCVASADYDEMSNDWFGFVSWHEQDWSCADGEHKGGES